MKYVIYYVITDRGTVGRVRDFGDGFRFFPYTPARRPSTKGHPTVKAAIPRWVGDYELRERVIVTND